MAECERFHLGEATLVAADVDLFVRGYKWKSFVKREVDPESLSRESSHGLRVGLRVLTQPARRQAGILQVLAARRASTHLLERVVPPKLWCEHKYRHRDTSMKTVMDEVGERRRPTFTKADCLLSGHTEQLSGPVNNMIARLLQVRDWLLFKVDAWKDQSFTYTLDDASEPEHVISVGSSRQELFLRELEAAILEISEPGSGILTKFILQLLLGESVARAELRPEDTFTSPICFAPFLTLFLPLFRPFKISNLILRNIVLNDDRAFHNLLKGCPNLHTLECCVENVQQLTELGRYGEKLFDLTLRGVPHHLDLESFSKAFFELNEGEFRSISKQDSRLRDSTKLANLEAIHLIDAIVEEQSFFLLRMAQLCPDLKRVKSNFKPLSASTSSVTETCNITELYFEGESPVHFFNQGLNEYFPKLHGVTLGDVDYLFVAKCCNLAVTNIRELNLTANSLTKENSDWANEILPCLIQLRSSLISLHIKILGVVDPETLLKIFINFGKLVRFSVEYRGSIPGPVPAIGTTNLQNFRLACVESKSDATEALILASVLEHSPRLVSIDIEMSFNALARAVDAIKKGLPLRAVRSLRLHVPGNSNAIACEIEKLIIQMPSLTNIKVVNDKSVARRLLEIPLITGIRVSWSIETGEENGPQTF